MDVRCARLQRVGDHQRDQPDDRRLGREVLQLLHVGVEREVVAAGLDPDNLPAPDPGASYRRRDDRPPAWKTIWGAGQGVGAIDAVEPVATVVARLRSEYDAARRALAESGYKE